jgi:hypothetical protein
VKAGVFESTRRQPLGGRRLARSAERARRAEADVVEQHDEYIWSAGERANGRELRRRILGVIEHCARVTAVRNRQHVASDIIVDCHRFLQKPQRETATALLLPRHRELKPLLCTDRTINVCGRRIDLGGVGDAEKPCRERIGVVVWRNERLLNMTPS